MSDKLFTVDTLKSSVGGNMFDTLSNAAINKGANFLEGKVCSAFTKMTTTGVGGNLTSLAVTGMGSYQTFLAVANKDFIEQFVGKLVTETVSIVSTKISEAIATKSMAIAMKGATAPIEIMNNAKYFFNAYKHSLSEEVNKKLSKLDTQAVENVEKEEKKGISKFIDKSKTTIEKIGKKAEEYSNIAAEKAAMVSEYLTEGPDWVSDQVNKHVNHVVSDVTKYINTQGDKVEKEIEKFIEQKGKAMGKTMAEKYNIAIEEIAEATVNSMKEKITKGKLTANKAKQSAVLKIAALVGI